MEGNIKVPCYDFPDFQRFKTDLNSNVSSFPAVKLSF